MRGRKTPSREWDKKARTLIAHGALTNSKRPECLVNGVYPTHLKKGEMAFVWDMEDNKYIDFICGLGSSILGHAHQEVCAAASRAIYNGVTLSLGTPYEIALAEKINEVMPFVQQMRFLKTGTSACQAAIRIARAFHGVEYGNEDMYGLSGNPSFGGVFKRSFARGLFETAGSDLALPPASQPKAPRTLILSEGYHGDLDQFIGLTPPHYGVISDPYVIPLRGNEEKVPVAAAVILEPIMTDFSEARINWLRGLRQRCTENGVVLIFDEIITGFRTPKFCMAQHLGIYPDLICLGKAIANGMPLSVVGGRRDIMSCGEYFVSSTFAGECASLASAISTVSLLQTKYDISALWDKGFIFFSQFNSMGPEIQIEGYPTRGVFKGDAEFKALFFQECCKAGIMFGPSFFFNFAHVEHMDIVLNTCKDVYSKIKRGAAKLEGSMPTTPFAQKAREQ